METLEPMSMMVATVGFVTTVSIGMLLLFLTVYKKTRQSAD